MPNYKILIRSELDPRNKIRLRIKCSKSLVDLKQLISQQFDEKREKRESHESAN